MLIYIKEKDSLHWFAYHIKNMNRQFIAIHFNAISVFPATIVRYSNNYSANIRKNKKRVYFNNDLNIKMRERNDQYQEDMIVLLFK
jgi:hypothetical protein